MPSPDDVAEAVAKAPDWNSRVALVRKIPEQFGTGEQARVYARVAECVYTPMFRSEFAYVHWREEYELPPLEAAYAAALAGTAGFVDVSPKRLTEVIAASPTTLRIFRLFLGFLVQELAEGCALVADQRQMARVSKSVITRAERGGRMSVEAARTCAATIDLAMTGRLFPRLSGALRLKIDKPDTARGWSTVQEFAARGVPLPVLLHQRAYGGAFRQLLDATSRARGDLLENPLEDLLRSERVPYLRTGPHNQPEIARRFGLTVRPAPDFVVFDGRTDTLRAIVECKMANDGGTARDKAARYRVLRAESHRLGGVPLFAVLGGLGWRRTADALGPVIRDTDGRTFGLATLRDMLETEPFPGLLGLRVD